MMYVPTNKIGTPIATASPAKIGPAYLNMFNFYYYYFFIIII